MANTVNTTATFTATEFERNINDLFDTALEAAAVAEAEKAAKKAAERKAEEARLKAEARERRKIETKAESVCSNFNDISDLEKYIQKGGEDINEEFGNLIDMLNDAYNKYNLIDEKEFESKFKYLNEKHMCVRKYWDEYTKFLKNAFFKKVWSKMKDEMNLFVLENEELYLIDNLLNKF